MNTDNITTALGVVAAVGVGVQPVIATGKFSVTSLIGAAIIAAFGYFTNKSGKSATPASTIGNGASKIPPSSTGPVLKRVALGALAFVVLGLAACSFSSNTLAQSLIGLQAGLDAVLPLVDPGIKTEVDNGFAAAISTVENWKSGTPASEVIEAFKALAANLDVIPQLNSKDDDIIASAINFLDNEIALLTKTPTAQLGSPSAVEVAAYHAFVDDDSAAPAAFTAWLDEDSGTPQASAGRKHQWSGKQIKSYKQLKAEWKKLGVKVK